MSGLQWQFTMSLDGFMAGPGGDMSWLQGSLGHGPEVAETMERTGSLLVGNRTFRGDDPYADTPQQGEPYGGGWDGHQFVLTHNPPRTPVPGVTFVSDLREGIAAAKAAAGDKYVGVLGANVARQCLEAGVLDEILMFVAPVLLGDGTRVFDHPGGTRIALERIPTGSSDPTYHRLRVVR
ncbi:dihydrofolate reductase family protein [Actinocorallia sp. B10E7]|uniref:dihydrofolate reductase family protein n=1 Tax=Actinocorallia sp. B10E7 TaxID=3153558 RepID=UPI00325DA4FB